MKILGYLGSPRVNSLTAKLLDKTLEGAASTGAEVKRINLIKSNIEHCRGCCVCRHQNHELKIGKCPIKDDMAGILEEYIEADGYIFATPVYDVAVTALMKKFLERKIALTYRDKDDYAKLGGSRCPAHFKKAASFIVTGNCGDEFEEVMGGPCFEMMNGHLMIEQVWLVNKCYVGGVESFTDEILKDRLDKAFKTGTNLIEEIIKLREEED